MPSKNKRTRKMWLWTLYNLWLNQACLISSESCLVFPSGSSVIPPIKLSVITPLVASTLAAISEVFPAIQTNNGLPSPSKSLLNDSGICCVVSSSCAVLASGIEILLLSIPRDFAISSIPCSCGVYCAWIQITFHNHLRLLLVRILE